MASVLSQMLQTAFGRGLGVGSEVARLSSEAEGNGEGENVYVCEHAQGGPGRGRLRPSGRAVQALNCLAISAAPQ